MLYHSSYLNLSNTLAYEIEFINNFTQNSSFCARCVRTHNRQSLWHILTDEHVYKSLTGISLLWITFSSLYLWMHSICLFILHKIHPNMSRNICVEITWEIVTLVIGPSQTLLLHCTNHMSFYFIWGWFSRSIWNTMYFRRHKIKKINQLYFTKSTNFSQTNKSRHVPIAWKL